MSAGLLIGITQEAHPRVCQRLVGALRARWDTVDWLDLSPGSTSPAPQAGVQRIDPQGYAAEAHRRVRETFPAWLYETAKALGLLDLWYWRQRLSLWWLMAISEMSPLRTPLIHILYQLQIVDQVLATHRQPRVMLLTDDPLIGFVTRQLVDRRGGVLERVVRVRTRLGLRQHVARWQGLRRCWFLLQQLARWATLRLLRLDVLPRETSGSGAALFCTMLPAMWEQTAASSHGWRNRSFGDWPALLERRGHRPVFGTITGWSGWQILRRARALRRQCVVTRSVPLEPLVPLGVLLRACLGGAWLTAYRRWRAAHRGLSVSFDGLDVGPLLLREIDQDARSPEVSFNLCVAEGTFRLASQLGRLACATQAFEYQPMEKAFVAAVKLADPRTPIIGFQTGLTGRNHLGYWFPREQVASPSDEGSNRIAAPVPDLIAVNGRTTLEVLQPRLGPKRVVWTGPVRLGHLRDPAVRRDGVSPNDAGRGRVAGAGTAVLVATLAMPDESWFILREVFTVGSEDPRVLFLIRAHPLCPVDRMVTRLAQHYHGVQYRLCEERTDELLTKVPVVITGATSVGIEAIRRGCMPIVYDGAWRYDGSPMRDVEDGVFFFRNAVELRHALAETLAHGPCVQQRRLRWPAALERLCAFPQGDPSAALFEALWAHGR